jgi:hypothetical protein
MQNLMTPMSHDEDVEDLATFRARGFEDSEPENVEALSVALDRLPKQVAASPRPDSWMIWQSRLEEYGLPDVVIGDLSVWTDVLLDDEYAYRFTLTENLPLP